ncbi:HD-GYP domain-containing protein [Noviherbaspirillum sp. UKPF54]|uniref:HD-GYP domain-containing protein n=1 Tax=Noviherbaspirillum sp. UKPF54 TaxID=2601898 RepID=UPI0011B19F24|nr:HD domain-containing phosphohydrolase [Noviherbaspirillum sp. UKPF54]QDZ29870.1 HD domain-containing protein [Noviherbaspirillum sp. UKPF54]
MHDLSDFSASRRYTEALAVALHERDPYTSLHCDRVIALSMELGAACDLSRSELGMLAVSASFHDIGKIGIPDHVLRKPGGFTPEEWEIMKTHPARGERILRATLLPDAGAIGAVVRHHHEHFDGSGYPDGLARQEIPLMSRILSVADSYDAMASSRVYHHKRTHDEILAVMHTEVSSKFDPSVFEQFARVIERSASRAQ